jgi:signal transduction histidine kinase
MVTTLLVVFASVLIFQPLRELIQLWLDRYFFRGQYYYQKTISDLSEDNLKLYHSLIQTDKLAALGTIAAGMAHEIKNPLAAIKGLTQILPENLFDQDFIKKYQTIVPRQLDRINQIVEDLLDFGHPKELVIKKVEVVRVLDEVLRLVENQCRQADVVIVKKFAPVPPVLADQEKLAQAFMNIILNAVQLMPTGGALTVAVYESTIQADLTPVPRVVVEIVDTGSGIPAEKLPKIFDPFYTTKETGSGMGLAVTYRIIQEHKGSLDVMSEIGRGTTFKISLKQENDI